MVNFISALLFLFSEERKAFLLRAVNKVNKRHCQGWDKHLETELIAAKRPGSSGKKQKGEEN